MIWGVVQFPGSCDERDALAAAGLVGEARMLWHADDDLDGVDAVVVPGGFSYGDYLRAGALARFSRLMEALAEFAQQGGPVLGICNGFQVLCEAGLLPGVLRANRQLEFLCADVTVTVESTATPFTAASALGDELVIPVKHGEGSWFGDAELVAELEARGQIVLRYTEDVNGSVGRIAGVANDVGNVMGLMPHPEHAVDPLLGSGDGATILASLVDAALDRALAPV